MKTKPIILSAIAALAGIAVAAGGTYALFTSESKTDIGVTSGKVSVKTVIENFKMYSGQWNEEAGAYDSIDVTSQGKFVNGGTASFSEEGTLTLSKISPMDKVEFDVKVTNESNVTIKQRCFVKSDDPASALLEALNFSFGGYELENGEVYSQWTVAEVGEEPDVMHVVIELPQAANNTVQNLECNLTVGVEAIQGNAKTDDWVSQIKYIATAQDLVDFANEVNGGNTYNGKKVKMVADIDLDGIAWTPIGNVTSYPGITFAGTFDGCEHSVLNMNASDNLQNYASAGFFGSLKGTVKNLTIKDFAVTSTHYAGAIFGYTSNVAKVENCKVINGTVTSTPELIGGEYDNGDKVGGIAGYVTAGSSINDCYVEGVTVTAYRDLGGIVGAAACSVTNCAIKDSYVYQDETNGYKAAGSITTYAAICGRDLGGEFVGNTETNVVVESIN